MGLKSRGILLLVACIVSLLVGVSFRTSSSTTGTSSYIDGNDAAIPALQETIASLRQQLRTVKAERETEDKNRRYIHSEVRDEQEQSNQRSGRLSPDDYAQRIRLGSREKKSDQVGSGAGLSEDICSILPNPLPRTSNLWNQYMHNILEWSVHPYDEDRVFVPFSAELLNILTVDRLQRSVKSVPHRQWESIKSILEVIYQWYEYAQNNRTLDGTAGEPPRKVSILVLGGSVADGDKCNPIGIAKLEQRRRKCAWPYRLEFMLNRILGNDAVEVKTATLGGTNTESSLMLLEYDLVPAEVDIIIHAYATNDMHLQAVERAQARNVTLRDQLYDITEQFIRRALERCRPSGRPAPLLVYFDDYIGNEHRVIRDAAVAAESVPFLANYYGILMISYADAVRDLVYGDVWESWFSPSWFKRRPRYKYEFVRQVHPGMGMHITSAWLVLYSLVDSMLLFCDKAKLGTGLAFELVGNETDILPYKKPETLYRQGIPPRLYPDLLLEDVSAKWSDKQVNCTRSERCIFAWVSRITVNCMWAPELNETMQKWMVSNQGWEAVYDYFKLGFEVTGGPKAKFVLEFLNVSLPISEVMLTVMKSYGAKWSASRIRLEILNRRNGGDWERVRITNPEVVGVHDKNTSEQYSSISVFRKGPVGVSTDLRVSIELKAGTTFKIMGMAVCSSI